MAQKRDEILLRKVVERIRQIRSDRNITLEMFFFDTGIHLARIESQRRNVSISTLKRICTYFEISMSEFFASIEE